MLPTEVIDALNAVQAGLGEIPVPILAAIILGAPTLMWLGFRYFVVQARADAARAVDGGPMYWICQRCRSANEIPGTRCYQCGMEQGATTGALQVVAGDELIVVDGAQVVRQPAPLDRPLVAVGPGHEPIHADPGVRSVVGGRTAADRPSGARSTSGARRRTGGAGARQATAASHGRARRGRRTDADPQALVGQSVRNGIGTRLERVERVVRVALTLDRPLSSIVGAAR